MIEIYMMRGKEQRKGSEDEQEEEEEEDIQIEAQLGADRLCGCADLGVGSTRGP